MRDLLTMQPANVPTSCQFTNFVTSCLKSVLDVVLTFLIFVLAFLFCVSIFWFLGSLYMLSAGVVSSRVFFLWSNPVTSITISNRESDVEFLRKQIRHGKYTNGKYLVVHGTEGIGKTCAIKTAVQNMRGVIFTDFIPETNSKDIVQIALYSVAQTQYNLQVTALHIMNLYKYLTGDTLTLVLNVQTPEKSI